MSQIQYIINERNLQGKIVEKFLLFINGLKIILTFFEKLHIIKSKKIRNLENARGD